MVCPEWSITSSGRRRSRVDEKLVFHRRGVQQRAKRGVSMSDDTLLFAMYFSGLVSMQLHPRNNGNEIRIEELKELAEKMVAITLNREVN